jgi:hypothetical protein
MSMNFCGSAWFQVSMWMSHVGWFGEMGRRNGVPAVLEKGAIATQTAAIQTANLAAPETEAR